MRHIFLSLALGAVLAGSASWAMAGSIASRAELQALLGDAAILEDFSGFDFAGMTHNSQLLRMADGTTLLTVLDSTSVVTGQQSNGQVQGPGLVVDGVSFSWVGDDTQQLLWMKAAGHSLPSNALSVGRRSTATRETENWLRITFDSPVDAFGLDLSRYGNVIAPNPAVITVLGVDLTTVLGTFAVNVPLPAEGPPVFTGWQDSAGIGGVLLTHPDASPFEVYAPAILQLEFGLIEHLWLPPQLGLFDGGFGDTSRWNKDAAPQGSDSARFDIGNAVYIVTLDQNYTHRRTRVGSDDVTFDLNGMTYHLNGPRADTPVSLAIGLEAGQHGQVTLLDGTLRTASDVEVQAANFANASLTVRDSARMEIGLASDGELRVGTMAGTVQVAQLIVEEGAKVSTRRLTAGQSARMVIEAPLIVGDAAREAQADRGFFALDSITVRDGGRIDSRGGVINGATAGDPADILISGQSSRWLILDTVSEFFHSITVGDDGHGTLSIRDGARVVSGASSVLTNVGMQAAANGAVDVGGRDASGNAATFDSDVLRVGVAGTGRLRIEEGGQVTGRSALVGLDAGSDGGVIVTGAGSKWSIDFESLVVGVRGKGDLTVNDGAHVETIGIGFGSDVGGNGSALVQGPGTRITSGVAAVGGSGQGTVIVEQGASFEVLRLHAGLAPGHGTVFVRDAGSRIDATQTITLGGLAGGQGNLIVSNAGVAESQDTVNVGVGGVLQIATAGVVKTFALNVDAGGIVEINSGGILETHGGNVLAGGRIIGDGGMLRIESPQFFVNNGYVAPGLSPGTLTIDGNYEQGANGVLEIEFAGLGAGQFDQLIVTGDATLGGVVEMLFLDGFAPKMGDVLSFLEVGGELNAESVQFVFPNLLPGFEFTTGFSSQGVFSLTAINDAQLVPEPASLALLLIAAAGPLFIRRRRR